MKPKLLTICPDYGITHIFLLTHKCQYSLSDSTTLINYGVILAFDYLYKANVCQVCKPLSLFLRRGSYNNSQENQMWDLLSEPACVTSIKMRPSTIFFEKKLWPNKGRNVQRVTATIWTGRQPVPGPNTVSASRPTPGPRAYNAYYRFHPKNVTISWLCSEAFSEMRYRSLPSALATKKCRAPHWERASQIHFFLITKGPPQVWKQKRWTTETK